MNRVKGVEENGEVRCTLRSQSGDAMDEEVGDGEVLGTGTERNVSPVPTHLILSYRLI
jgi:hypothetical protein